MMEIWLVNVNYGDNDTITDSAWTERDDAFQRYAALVTERFSTDAGEVAAKDYAPGKELEYSDRYTSEAVMLKRMRVHQKGGK